MIEHPRVGVPGHVPLRRRADGSDLHLEPKAVLHCQLKIRQAVASLPNAVAELLVPPAYPDPQSADANLLVQVEPTLDHVNGL